MPDPRSEMRRKDREVSDPSELHALLERGQYGTLATSIDSQPYQNINLFWFDADQQRIYLHTALQGRTYTNIEANPRVCFSVAEMGRLLPAETALEFSVEYASVIAFGQARIVEDASEARRGLQGLLDKYFPDLKPGVHYRPIIEEELQQTAVYAIDIESMSGKRKAVMP
jgi:nitroimidazol reductase NimA-like FMN-containing flavoprotein (pyridoxamine 5'-phosphate oxidase superfamily)